MAFPIFDGHNDTLTRLVGPGRDDAPSFFERDARGHLDLPRARAGGLVGGIFAIFTPPPPDHPDSDPYYGLTITATGYTVSPRSPVPVGYAREHVAAVLDGLQALLQAGAGRVGLVRRAADLEENLRAGVFSLVLHLEGAAAVGTDLERLAAYHAAGLRSLGLVWSRPNAFGHGVPFRFPHSPDTGPGLTAAGRRLVRACRRLGILVDLAHINARGFWDVAALSDAPLVVSHAGAHALCPSSRNLTDNQIDAVGRSGGLIGVIFEPINTRADGRPAADTPLATVVDHIDYVAHRIGVEHVALGSDFDGADMPAALGDAAGLPRLLAALRGRGYDDDALAKIAYQNWFRVLRAHWHA